MIEQEIAYYSLVVIMLSGMIYGTYKLLIYEFGTKDKV